MSHILVVDDDRNHCKVLKGLLESIGLQALVAYSADTAIPKIETKDLDLIITDLKMPGKSGMDLLTLCQERKPSVPVILITAYGTIESAIEALKKGAYDFITKPFDENELLNVIKKALLESQKNKELISAYFEKEQYFLPDIIGSTPSMQHVFKTVHKIAPTDSTVLVTGETGVGKELIAKAIHSTSHRRNNTFVKVNCNQAPIFSPASKYVSALSISSPRALAFESNPLDPKSPATGAVNLFATELLSPFASS